jgi:thiol-disulfide isomerase/thioredoxin
VTGAARAVAVALALVATTARAEEPGLRSWTRGETPALSGIDVVGGRPLELRALRGRVVLVQFWASWCEPCEVEMPAISRLRAALAARPFEVVTVNYGEGPARVEQFAREHRLELPVVLDRDQRIGRAWGVGGLPMAFLVDAEGRVRSSVFGECDWTRGEPAAALERLIADAERSAGRTTDRR